MRGAFSLFPLTLSDSGAKAQGKLTWDLPTQIVKGNVKDVAPYSVVDITDVSEVVCASIIRANFRSKHL